jgi:hypothetical protein
VRKETSRYHRSIALFILSALYSTRRGFVVLNTAPLLNSPKTVTGASNTTYITILPQPLPLLATVVILLFDLSQKLHMKEAYA